MNPASSPGMLPQARETVETPVAMPIDSDPPALSEPPSPVEISFDDEEPVAAVTEPPGPERPARARSSRPGAGRMVFAWVADLLGISAVTAACIAFTLHQAQVRYPLDFLRDTAPLWLALFCAVCVAYSWAFTALAARTPGMALAGERMRSIHGGPPTPGEALARALLALASAALGMSGFVLALFDRRAQTLHDKLCRCVIVVD